MLCKVVTPSLVPEPYDYDNSEYPIEKITQLPVVQYGTITPPYHEIMSGKPMMGCKAGDLLDVLWLQEATWNFGPSNTLGNACEFAGFIMIRQLNDVGPIQIQAAGPEKDARILTQNPGENVTWGTHHQLLPWGRLKWRIPFDGDFRAACVAYAGGGAYFEQGQYLDVHDGTLSVALWRTSGI